MKQMKIPKKQYNRMRPLIASAVMIMTGCGPPLGLGESGTDLNGQIEKLSSDISLHQGIMERVERTVKKLEARTAHLANKPRENWTYPECANTTELDDQRISLQQKQKALKQEKELLERKKALKIKWDQADKNKALPKNTMNDNATNVIKANMKPPAVKTGC